MVGEKWRSYPPKALGRWVMTVMTVMLRFSIRASLWTDRYWDAFPFHKCAKPQDMTSSTDDRWLHRWIYHQIHRRIALIHSLGWSLVYHWICLLINYHLWLVGGEKPLWNIWVRQLGWLATQYMGKCQKWPPNHQPDLTLSPCYQETNLQRRRNDTSASPCESCRRNLSMESMRVNNVLVGRDRVGSAY